MPCSSEVFKKYPNSYFIETGSYLGEGIDNAIKAGFENIISIELSKKYFDICQYRFKNYANVKIYYGDSYKILPEIINNINKPITFWLDGHHSAGDTALGDYYAPLLQELDAIREHSINTHTIMIDDMRCWAEPNPVHGFFYPNIIDKLHSINPNYTLTYEDGFVEKDVLVALLLQEK